MISRVLWLLVLMGFHGIPIHGVEAEAKRIILDTDVDTDDFFALLYLLKQNRSEIDLQAVTISANAWTDAGHSVNHIYDILYMMGRDDIHVGVGGEGGILPNGTILPNVGGYLPLIEQGMSTVGDCRYRQAIPVGAGGRLDSDTNAGIRRSFLPQGKRRYSPLEQPTAQKVMIDMISVGLTTIILTGAHTNLAIFLMSSPHLKKNIEHIFVMGGGVRSKNPTGCCPRNGSTLCKPKQCGDHGNLFSAYTSNPYAEYNIFADPFAAYQVIHSGIPVTLVPLDATNTIPTNERFFKAFEQEQDTYEARYCFQSLKLVRDTWSDNQFYKSYFMWDSFASGIAVSIMRNGYNNFGENEFAEMKYLNITVVTSNKPYGIHDGSNPFFDDRIIPKFNLQKGGVHSGHVQNGLEDPFCLVDNGNGKGKCEDGYTNEVTGREAVHVLVAQKAKKNQDIHSPLDRQFFKSFLDVLNLPMQSGRFNFTSEFPYYKEVLYKPDFMHRKLGKAVVFDMDMSAGDFLSLIYLLKVPVDVVDLKGILVSGNGWANLATIDIIYDVLHMMGRDDIPVGLGNVTALGNPSFSCKYVKAIPNGCGGSLDSDTLYGLARDLPRSPRRYTAENSVEHGAPRNTEHPELRQPLVLEVLQSITRALSPINKLTILTSGPLTNLANIVLSNKNVTSMIEKVYIVGGHITEDKEDRGNVFSVASNKYSEFNFYLDPQAAKTVIESELDITLIPLKAQRRDIFLGEILGSVLLANGPVVKPVMKAKLISVLVGDITKDGQITINKDHGRKVHILDDLNQGAFYNHFTGLLGDKTQSAVIGSFDEQIRKWTTPSNMTGAIHSYQN